MARILITCTDEEQAEIFELARQCRTSVSLLGRRTLMQAVVAARAGAVPMIAPSTVKNAVTTEKPGFSIDFSSPTFGLDCL